jgi:hypothetical protein
MASSAISTNPNQILSGSVVVNKNKVLYAIHSPASSGYFTLKKSIDGGANWSVVGSLGRNSNRMCRGLWALNDGRLIEIELNTNNYYQFYYRIIDGDTIGDETLLVDEGSGSWYGGSAGIVDKDGSFWFFYSKNNSSGTTIKCKKYITSWSDAVTIYDNTSYIFTNLNDNNICTDSSGNIYLYGRMKDSSHAYDSIGEIKYTASTETWGTPTVLVSGSSSYTYGPECCLCDTSDYRYVAYFNTSNGSAGYIKYTTSWGSFVEIRANAISNNYYRLLMLQNASGDLYFLYSGSAYYTIPYYKKYTGGSWGPETNLETGGFSYVIYFIGTQQLGRSIYPKYGTISTHIPDGFGYTSYFYSGAYGGSYFCYLDGFALQTLSSAFIPRTMWF